MAGYSGIRLTRKLGITPETLVVAIDPPPHYRKLLGKSVKPSQLIKQQSNGATFVHFFTTDRDRLQKQLTRLRRTMDDSGTVWVSWPKKSSGTQTNVTEDVIRDVALPLGFVDVKVCAVDEVWSGLKLVVRRENRKSR